ncbi:MAG: DUF5688 family protein [Lachnospiraceae bacterium]|nr:DUF5688 family protein [Lachnospiraceae bacterium]
MTYDTFKQDLLALLQKRMGDTMHISTKEFLKNNNLKLDGLIMTDSKVNISPTIYLNYYYDLYKDGTCTLDEICNKIITCYKKYELNNDFDISLFTDFENVRDNIVFKLINFEQNRTLLERIPHVKYLDLAIIFYYHLPYNSVISDLTNDVEASIQISKEHLDHWNVCLDDIFKLAKINTPKIFPAAVQPLADVINEMLEAEGLQYPEIELDDFTIYMVSNQSRYNGASTILYQDLLQECAQKFDRDLIIIPSSIHEILYLPKTDDIDLDHITQMVKSVNETEVALEDILSDHAYLYDRKKHELICA